MTIPISPISIKSELTMEQSQCDMSRNLLEVLLNCYEISSFFKFVGIVVFGVISVFALRMLFKYVLNK